VFSDCQSGAGAPDIGAIEGRTATAGVNILLDECVPRPPRKLLANHTCRTTREIGWKSAKNGELLTLAETQFDLFITSDQGLAYQENLLGRRIAILELSTNKLRLIEAAAAQLQDAVEKISHAEFRRLEISR
jgi:predicted nuclease of predicted toxin-antitoxin system